MKHQSEKKLTPAQLQIMNLFWEHGELGVAQVWKMLSEQRPVARNTVQTMLSRLAERGWLRAQAKGSAYVYRPARRRGPTLSGMVGALLDGAFAGSASRLVMTLLEHRSISPEEAQRLRELIDQAEDKR